MTRNALPRIGLSQRGQHTKRPLSPDRIFSSKTLIRTSMICAHLLPFGISLQLVGVLDDDRVQRAAAI